MKRLAIAVRTNPMTRYFNAFDQHSRQEPRVAMQSGALNGVVVSHLDKASNDTSVSQIGNHAVPLSLSGSDQHRMRIGDRHRDAPTARHDIALTDVARVAGMDVSSLTPPFRRHTGPTPCSPVIERRLRPAEDLPPKTDVANATVAGVAGFGAQVHMTRLDTQGAAVHLED